MHRRRLIATLILGSIAAGCGGRVAFSEMANERLEALGYMDPAEDDEE
jgi:hypothetical protein